MSVARRSYTVLAAATVLVAIAGAAQAPGIKRTLLQKLDIPAGEREAVQAIAEIAPGVAAGRHTHFGPEFGYVLEGSSELSVDGEAPRVLKAGDSYLIPAGKVHDAKGVGDKPVKVLATYLVEKGKPLATPAP
jgi:quercetin dioxygenase-like cupin family protein